MSSFSNFGLVQKIGQVSLRNAAKDRRSNPEDGHGSLNNLSEMQFLLFVHSLPTPNRGAYRTPFESSNLVCQVLILFFTVAVDHNTHIPIHT